MPRWRVAWFWIIRYHMKWSTFRIPFAFRVFIFILGIVFASLPIQAVYAGRFDLGDHGQTIDISMARDSLAFWALVVIFSLLSAGLFFGAFAKRLPDA